MRFVPPIPLLVRLVTALVLVLGVPYVGLAMLPPEYWTFGWTPLPPLFDSADVVAVAVLGLVGHGALGWRRRRLTGPGGWSQAGMALVWMVATAASGTLWWKASFDPGRDDSWLRPGAVVLTIVLPLVLCHLARGMARSLSDWRRGERESLAGWLRHRRLVLGAGATLVTGIGVFWYVEIHRPLACLYSERLVRLDREARRALCHQTLRYLALAPHDAFVWLSDIGDEESVPLIINALRWGDDSPVCTFGHGRGALKSLTNQTTDGSYAAWRRWYEANRHKSRLDWIVAGFTARGFAVTRAGDEGSVREASRALGEDQSNGAARNALDLLESYDPGLVNRVREEAARDGSATVRMGCALSGQRDGLAVEPLLRRLLVDPERRVSWAARLVLSSQQLRRTKDGPRLEVEVIPVGSGWHGQGPVSLEGVVCFLAPHPRDQEAVVAYDLRERRVVWEQATGARMRDAPAAGDRHVYFNTDSATDSASVQCRELKSGALLWKVDVDLESTEGSPLLAGPLVIVNGHAVREDATRPRAPEARKARKRKKGQEGEEMEPSPEPHMVLLRQSDGAKALKLEGRALGAAGELLYVVQGSSVIELRLSDLQLARRFQIVGSVLGIAAAGDTLAFVVRREPQDPESGAAELVVEGWSLETGRRGYTRTIREDFDEGEDCLIGQGSSGVLHGSSGDNDYSFAVDLADGRVLWEIPFGGDMVELGGVLAVHVPGWGILFLDRATGDLVACHDPDDAHGMVWALRVFDGRLFAFAEKALLRIEPPRR